jgi:hypothetical protein
MASPDQGSGRNEALTAPFDPESATEEFAKVLHSYQIRYVTGDRYAGEWVAQAFLKRRVTYKQSELPKSGLYVDFLPKLNSRTISIPDIPRLVNQIAALERRTSRDGKDSMTIRQERTTTWQTS